MEVDHSQEAQRRQRASVLGFEPQHEIPYNQLLPYADVIDEESQRTLQDIKDGLSIAVLSRDVRLGASFWGLQLTNYQRLYGHKYSKSDHIYFVKIFYSLLEIEDIEVPLLDNLLQVLLALLKKRHLLIRGEDLILDWRVLFNLLKRFYYSKDVNIDLLVVPQYVQNKLRTFIRCCQSFFDMKATKEILQECRPLFSPYDNSMRTAIDIADLFLPVIAFTQEERRHSWMIWKDEFLAWWLSIKNGPVFERVMISLFAKLAYNNIGHIDWSNCVEPLFTRILRGFRLPVGKLQFTTALAEKIPMELTTVWLVSMMGSPQTSQLVLTNLATLIKAIETYFHPSNHGSWVSLLANFVYHFLNQLMNRVFRERSKVDQWKPEVPVDHRISDDEIEEVITILKPIAFMLLYNKGAFNLNIHILQIMNQLRPDLVTPVLMEKTFVASDSLTEPFHFRACLSALSNMLFPSVRRFPEIRKHIVPLLIGCLPGLDPNDLPKTVATFKLMNMVMVLVPMVDCSKAVRHHSNLSEDERELCFATAQLDDFVAQFFDRCLVLIENLKQDDDNNSEHQPMLQMESAFKNFIIASTGIVLHQSSKSIALDRLKNLFTYSTTHLFEGKPAISTFAGIVASCAKVNPGEAYAMFLPHYCNSILEYCRDNPEIGQDRKLSKQFIWDIKILIELMHVGMAQLLDYKDMLFEVVDEVLKLDVKQAYKSVGALVSGMMASWITFYVNDRKNVNHSNAQLEESYLAINDWAHILTPSQVHLNWHNPTEDEFEATFEAVDRFLMPVLAKLKRYAADEIELSKEEIENYLIFIHDMIGSITDILPFEEKNWDGESYDSPLVLKSVLPVTFHTLSFYEVCMARGDRKNMRLNIFKAVRSLLYKLLRDRENDVEAILHVISIYQQCLYFQENARPYYNDHWKFYTTYKTTVADFMKPKKCRERSVIAERALLQHEMRVVNNGRIRYTPMMHDIMLDLIKLSVSNYAKVRLSAQSAFFSGLSNFPMFVYKAYLPIILAYIDPANNPTHEQHKGALYLLLGKTKSRMFLAFFLRWQVMRKVWPAILRAPHSDKPSIQRLSSKLIKKLSNYYMTIVIKNVVPDESVKLASEYLTSQCKFSSQDIAQLNQVGLKHELKSNESRLSLYQGLVEELVGLCNSHTLTWRLNEAALDMLLDLIRREVPISAEAVNLFVASLCDESVGVRDIAINSVAVLLHSMKRKLVKVMRTPQELNVVPADHHCPGDRPDNEWLLYDPDNKPNTKPKYESLTFVDKSCIGYYTWPEKIKVSAPYDQQQPYNRSPEEMDENEVVMYKFFTNQQFVDQFVEYMCLEREEAKAHIDYKCVEMLRSLFKKFGDALLPCFKPHIERLVKEKRENLNRCACELFTGVVAGSKHWTFEMMEALRVWISPLFRTAITNISSETIKDWGHGMNEIMRDRDPKRIWWLLDLLVDELASPSPSALVSGSRLYLIQSAVGQTQWRTPKILARIEQIVGGDQLSHAYKYVRLRMGTLLHIVYLHDVQMQGLQPMLMRNPSFDAIINSSLDHLEPLLREEAFVSMSASQIDLSAFNFDKPGDVLMKNPASAAVSLSSNVGDLTTLRNDRSVARAGGNLEVKYQAMQLREAHGSHSAMNHSLHAPDASLSRRALSSSSLAAGSPTDDERQQALRIFKTLAKVVCQSQRNSLRPFKTAFVDLLPFLCRLYPVSQQRSAAACDEELNTDARLCMSCIAQSIVEPDHMFLLIKKIEDIAQSSSWHMRLCLLPYIQVFLFVNLFSIRQQPSLLAMVKPVVMSLLEDERYEVAQMAGITLSGMIRCELVKIDDELMETANKLCKARVRKKRRRSIGTDEPTPTATSRPDSSLSVKQVHRRHAGVLVLSACILSSPYTVPDWMPDVVMRLSDFLHEPQPIQQTVKHTFSEFRRTHHDNWHEDKFKFTSDQRLVLTDLLVSPNYYA